MKLDYTEDQINKISAKLIRTGSAKLWKKNGEKRIYLSNGICCEISSKLENQDTVSPYIDLISKELISMSDEAEDLAWSEIKSILKNK